MKKFLTRSLILFISFLFWMGCDSSSENRTQDDSDRVHSTLTRGAGKSDHAKSCKEICGKKAVSGCWCDEKCADYGDCCADKAEQCDEKPASCAGHCGSSNPEGCFCDDKCAQYGDCCSDKTEVCDESQGCLNVMCALSCPFGYKDGEDGCPICSCNENPMDCQPVLCELECVNGFATDAVGCGTCDCSEGPPVLCPSYPPPPQGWCDGGEIESGGLDEIGCKKPPICVQ
jgi:hypothetical protein